MPEILDENQRPAVLFVCVHNAGRSQMAAGLLTLRSRGRIDVRSAGSAPADEIDPNAIVAIVCTRSILTEIDDAAIIRGRRD